MKFNLHGRYWMCTVLLDTTMYATINTKDIFSSINFWLTKHVSSFKSTVWHKKVKEAITHIIHSLVAPV